MRKELFGNNTIIFPDHKILSRDECYELVKIYRNESLPEKTRITARNRVVECNQKYIVRFVQLYLSSHKDKKHLFKDLWDAANEGFIKAFDKADLNKLKYIKFSTYASYWMLVFIGEEIANDGNIKYASSKHKKMKDDHKIARRKTKYMSPEHVKRIWNEFDHKWGEMKSNSGNMTSLDQKVSDNSKCIISDTVAIDEDDGTVQTAGKSILHKELKNTINRLPNIERKVVTGIYGVDRKEQNFNELCEELDLPKNKVKKIRDDALKNIKKDKKLKKVLSSLGIMTSITNGHSVYSLINKL